MSNDEDPAPTRTEAIRDKNRRIREEAAEKRRKKREAADAKPVVARGGLDAGEMVDDALARGTHALTGWLKRNFNVLQWVLVIGLVGGVGFQVYRYQRDKTEGASTDKLMAGVLAETARVGEGKGEADPRTGIEDTRATYPDEKARVTAAEKAYRAVVDDKALGALARMGLAGALFDLGKFKEALAEYRTVRQSALADKDPDLRCRAIEGIGLSEEGLGNTDPALLAFGELGKSDVPGFGPLGLYHQARLHQQKGASDKAKELLKSALEKMEKARGSGTQPTLTEQAARELLSSIDPSAAAAAPGPSLSPEQLRQLSEAAATEKGEVDMKAKLKELLDQIPINQSAPAPSGAASGAP